MDMSIPLNKMTIIEKLRAIEEIWENLLRDSENVFSPAWHADVLSAREQRIRDGKSQFSDWNEAKSRRKGAGAFLIRSTFIEFSGSSVFSVAWKIRRW
jgi:hypothetical protein